MEIKKILADILNDNVSAVESVCFEQKLEADGITFTLPLSQEEEVAIAKRLGAGVKAWEKFLQRYFARDFFLCNEAMCELLQNADVCKDALVFIYSHTASSPAQMTFLCKDILANGMSKTKKTILETAIERSRIYDAVVKALLEQVDGKFETAYAEAYVKAVQEYRKKTGLLSYFS